MSTSPVDKESGVQLGRKKTLVRPERARSEYKSHFANNNVNKLPENWKNDDLSRSSTMTVCEEPSSNKRSKKIRLGKQKNSFSYDLWLVYCYIVTFWAPPPVLKIFGMPKKDRQVAWREKMGLIVIIICLGVIVAFLMFGFTRTVCKNDLTKLWDSSLSDNYLVVNGRAYDLSNSSHPKASGIPFGTNVLNSPVNAAASDASFLFQNVNGNCKGLIKPRSNCSIPYNSDGSLAWYMPCKLFKRDGSTAVNRTWDYYTGYACHTSASARANFYRVKSSGDVHFSWKDINDSPRQLVVYHGDVLDVSLLKWLSFDDLEIPEFFTRLIDNKQTQGKDLSILLSGKDGQKMGRCLQEIIKVGTIDSDTVGCIASDIMLYTLLVFILSIIFAKFFVACYFRWFVAPKQGVTNDSLKEMNERQNEIEDWADSSNSNPVSRKGASTIAATTASTGFSKTDRKSLLKKRSPNYNKLEKLLKSDKNTFITMGLQQQQLYPSEQHYMNTLDPGIIANNTLMQPDPTYAPFGFPLAHTICLVTCYSEDEQGLRTTLDSISTAEYPNSHKLIFVVCDGLVKGSGNDLLTSDIVLGMMEEFVTPVSEVESHSMVAVAQGFKRHNKGKVFAGFYKYDDNTVPIEKQERTPMIVVVKCGTEEEQVSSSKPGNRGKRDSQIILMSFLQKITFNERMTQFEYEILKSIWQVTGLMASMYEIVLMVDADTKIYPDSLTHMVGEMVKDSEVMGLCGETKISNKSDSFTTMIQVFEYYISHHQSKAFESVFGGVTCLPGCFCMYRIKAPKEEPGQWVPLLANPDIVERYSDNVVNTLHRKNLLLLGEDRFLSTLMLRTFPKRKQIFVPKAACKTIVPDNFQILLSQRRRWINSTVHNLLELVLVKDLCGIFCFSMQFVVFIELIGTLVLPAAIIFTIYVIIFAIVSKPTPVMTLSLLAIIFGLPALLIVVTFTRLIYFVWMLIYLAALPIWNLIIPAYAYWKFDDFSWGETRKINDEKVMEENDEFDATDIIIKTWKEFEIERVKIDGGNIRVPSLTWRSNGEL